MGVMQVLEAEYIAVDRVVDCSGGSVFGAAIAPGFSYEESRELCAQTWSIENISKKDFLFRKNKIKSNQYNCR